MPAATCSRSSMKVALFRRVPKSAFQVQCDTYLQAHFYLVSFICTNGWIRKFSSRFVRCSSRATLLCDAAHWRGVLAWIGFASITLEAIMASIIAAITTEAHYWIIGILSAR